jgi:putative flavoprotein involved in K+ transport
MPPAPAGPRTIIGPAPEDFTTAQFLGDPELANRSPGSSQGGRMNDIYDAIVIGAGQAGLATGYHLKQAGLRFVILEAGRRPGGSWPRYYDSLTLFSPARYSGLPGLPFPGDPERYPTRDEVVSYLKDYARHFDLPVVSDAKVQEVERPQSVFLLRTSNTDYHSRTLVGASGSFYSPHLPRVPAQSRFQGVVLHSAAYQNREPFKGKRVIVVGAANSAVQIAVELTAVAKVTLATREPVRFIPQRFLGCDFHCWVQWTGLDFLPWLKDQSTPVLDSGKYRKALSARQPDQRPMFVGFTETGVMWSNGEQEPVDAVIFATGYRPNFPYLAGLGALDVSGKPLHRKGISSAVPGLYFVGMSGQRSFRSATLRGVGGDAAYVVGALRRQLGKLSVTESGLSATC